MSKQPQSFEARLAKHLEKLAAVPLPTAAKQTNAAVHKLSPERAKTERLRTRMIGHDDNYRHLRNVSKGVRALPFNVSKGPKVSKGLAKVDEAKHKADVKFWDDSDKLTARGAPWNYVGGKARLTRKAPRKKGFTLINPQKHLRSVYRHVPGGARRAVGVARKHGAKHITWRGLNRYIPIDRRSRRHMDNARAEAYYDVSGDRMSQRPRGMDKATLSHEIDHAINRNESYGGGPVRRMRNNLKRGASYAATRLGFKPPRVLDTARSFAIPRSKTPYKNPEHARRDEHDRQGDELRAEYLRPIKHYFASRGELATNPKQAREQLNTFYKKYKNPPKKEGDNERGQVDELMNSSSPFKDSIIKRMMKMPDLEKRYLQTVKAKKNGKKKTAGAQRDPRLTRAGVSGYNKPRRTPGHSTKSHIVVARAGGQVKTIRFGQQGVRTNQTAGQREAFKSRHARNISRGPLSAAYWANKVKWSPKNTKDKANQRWVKGS